MGPKISWLNKKDTWCARLVFVGVAVVVVVDHSWNACGAIQFVY